MLAACASARNPCGLGPIASDTTRSSLSLPLSPRHRPAAPPSILISSPVPGGTSNYKLPGAVLGRACPAWLSSGMGFTLCLRIHRGTFLPPPRGLWVTVTKTTHASLCPSLCQMDEMLKEIRVSKAKQSGLEHALHELKASLEAIPDAAEADVLLSQPRLITVPLYIPLRDARAPSTAGGATDAVILKFEPAQRSFKSRGGCSG